MAESLDRIFAEPLEQVSAFEFDERTTKVFEDMIVRSVPGYRMTVAMTGLVAKHFARPKTNVYDLGCSLGACTLAMATHIEADACHMVGVDNSAPMLEQCRHRFASLDLGLPIEWREEDIRETSLSNASVVVLNLTLQFLPIEGRQTLLSRICDSTVVGGALVLTEKIEFHDRGTDELLSDLHHEFKRRNGYDDLEISQKRQSLENVLVREPLESHIERLQNVGFSRVVPWLQCFNFVSLLAVK